MSKLGTFSSLAVAAMILTLAHKPPAYAQAALYRVILAGTIVLLTPSYAIAKQYKKKNPDAVIKKAPPPPAPPVDPDEIDDEED
jgi:hypothetical protein